MQLFEKLQKWMLLVQLLANLGDAMENLTIRSKHDYRLALCELWPPAPLFEGMGLIVLLKSK